MGEGKALQKFIHSCISSTCGKKSLLLFAGCLNIDPSRHPLLDGGLCLIDQAELKHQLDTAADTRLQSRRDPGVCVRRLLTNEDHLWQ